MHYPKDLKNTAFLAFSILYWIIAVFVTHFYAELTAGRVIERQQQDLRRDISLVRARIEAAIFEDIYKADSLATLVTMNNKSIRDNWEQVAEKLVNNSVYIRNIGLAPNNVITHIYPIKGNEAAIGLNFRTIPSQYKSVMEAKRQESVYLDGPLNLVQGGQAIIARYPIFEDFPTNQVYWGSVSVVLKYTDIIQESGLNDIHYANIAIQRTDLNDQKQVFNGSPSTFNDPDVTLPIYLPNTQWALAAKNTPALSGAVNQARSITYLFGGTGVLILYLSFYVLYRAYRFAHKVSLRDELTKLPNRRCFFNQIQQSIRRNKKNDGFALLNIDLDGFKHINDSFGHEAGDKMLKHVAKELQNAVTVRDFVARMGGDEFVIILGDTTDQNACESVMEHIKSELFSKPLYWHGHKIIPALSIGSSLFTMDHPLTAEELLSQADKQMYMQKQKGGKKGD